MATAFLSVTRYVNALPDVGINQTDIGHVMRDAPEFPVLAYTVDKRELTAKVPPISCH